MSSYYFVGQTTNGGPISGTTGTFTGNVTIGGTLVTTGANTAASFTVSPATGFVQWLGRAKLTSPADGQVLLGLNAGGATALTTGLIVGAATAGGGASLVSGSVVTRLRAMTGNQGANAAFEASSYFITNAGGGLTDASSNGLALTSSTISTFNTALVVTGGQGLYVQGKGTASPISDLNVPIQMDSGTAGSQKLAYFGANKAGGYGLLFGFSNDSAATGGVGGQFRMVTTDPFSMVVNNSVLAWQTVSSGAFNFSGGNANASTFNLKQLSAQTTLSLGSATTSLVTIPAGALVMAVTARVTTAITSGTSTTWSLGTGAIANDFGSGLAFASGTTVTGADYVGFTGSQMFPAATALNCVLNIGAATAGVVRVTVYYYDVTAPTS